MDGLDSLLVKRWYSAFLRRARLSVPFSRVCIRIASGTCKVIVKAAPTCHFLRLHVKIVQTNYWNRKTRPNNIFGLVFPVDCGALWCKVM